MKKRYIIIGLIVSVFLILSINNNCYAADLDEIVNYEIKVDPVMENGALDITYKITWKVLDSDTEGPLSWVKIGTPNSSFENPKALSDNIKSITPSGSYVRIVFDREYYEGEQLTFTYSIHQLNMYEITDTKCKYKFIPAWFDDAKVNNITLKWNMDNVIGSNTKNSQDNYLIWNKENLRKGEKITAKVEYNKNSFRNLKIYKKDKDSSFNGMSVFWVILIGYSILMKVCGIGGYYGHRGFYGGRGYHSGCVHSSCACAHSSCASSCACACAGSGRAGCSKKDFYGTNLKWK